MWIGLDESGRTLRPDGCADACSSNESDRAAVELVAPRVDDRPDAVHAERDRDVAGDRVGVHEEDALAAGDQRRGEVDGDHRLADAALGVEHGDQLAAPRPVAALELALRAPARCRRRTAMERMHHRLDPPADRLRRVGPRQVLVGLVAGASASSRSSVGGLTTSSAGMIAVRVEERPRPRRRIVGIALDVEDAHGDVAARGQEGGELAPSPSTVRGSKPAVRSSSTTGLALGGRQQERDDAGRPRVGDIEVSALRLGVAGGHRDHPVAGGNDPGGEAGHGRDRVAERDVRAMGHVEDELAVGARGDGDAPVTPGEPARDGA